MTDKNIVAPNPPRGWNSWDCYGPAVNELILLKNADYMAKHLKQYGYEYVICDIQWYEPKAYSYRYRDFASVCLDEFGRLLPATNRFPSAADGAGFQKIADKIHDMGLKFGVHLMRGVPRQAVYLDLPIKGTNHTAREIAHPYSVCAWNTDMYGLDYTKPGAQEYLDSVFELFASWGVDFVKVDDVCVIYGIPGDEATIHHGAEEIEMYRKAIDHSGRDMVLSLSPGPAIISKAEHLRKNANMWRITNDFWDNWAALKNMFERCKEWSPYVSEGCFPDCDMLPVGHISLIEENDGKQGRMTNLTKEEQRTMLSLWCIFRSPLMLGCELNDLDDWTKSLITNGEVLSLNQNSRDAKEVKRTEKYILWKATDLEKSQYAAIFNISDRKEVIELELKDLELIGNYRIYDLWKKEEIGTIDKKASFEVAAHDSLLIKLL